MKERKEKLKKWFEENKDEIKNTASKIGWYAWGFGLAWFVTDKITKAQINAGLAVLNAEGVIKFFNPENGNELNFIEASKFIGSYKK